MTRKTYTGPIIDVSFDGALCQHSANCVNGMPAVFDTARRPWIDPTVAADETAADRLREVVARCPSGALHIEDHAPTAD
ncbi:MAG: (4Fe-4S)-binding protein [Nocardioidaceae bacterium]